MQFEKVKKKKKTEFFLNTNNLKKNDHLRLKSRK